jgi:hypothetical protein
VKGARHARKSYILTGSAFSNALSLTAVFLLEPDRIVAPFGLLLGALSIVAAVGIALGHRFDRRMSFPEEVVCLAGCLILIAGFWNIAHNWPATLAGSLCFVLLLLWLRRPSANAK